MDHVVCRGGTVGQDRKNLIELGCEEIEGGQNSSVWPKVVSRRKDQNQDQIKRIN